jgi:signal transduction histidine kinase
MTEQKETEAELEKYRHHLEELVEKRTREVEEVTRRADTVIAASPDALIAMDDDGIITFISQHYRDVYPGSAHLLVPGKHILEAFDVVTRELRLPRDDPRYPDMYEWWKNPKGSKEFKLGGGTWLRLQAKRMQGASGTVISTTSITDYKRQQALLARQSEELAAALEKANDSVEQQKIFVSMVSLEFRTPLTIIDGNAQIIERRGETLTKEALKTRAVTIRAAVERLVRLIETILSAHMLESGRLSLNAASCDLEKIIRDVAADQRDISPNHKIRVDIRDLPEKMTLDEKLMRQVVANLLSNAVKYAPDSPEVDVRAFMAGGEAVIEVQDRGVGIPEKEQDKIFTRYFRASTSGGIPGSGLGLSLVRQFVELHGGRVSFASKEGEGTTIAVYLPVGGTP